MAEALSLGVPVIASDVPAHRELAPRASLIDPLDGLGWLNAVSDALAGRQSSIAPCPRSWADHFERVDDALRDPIAP